MGNKYHVLHRHLSRLSRLSRRDDLELGVAVTSIHRTAENLNSRKLTLKIVQPYTLGPGRKGTLPRSRTSGAGILIHRRIKIRLRFPRKRHTGSPSMYYA